MAIPCWFSADVLCSVHHHIVCLVMQHVCQLRAPNKQDHADC